MAGCSCVNNPECRVDLDDPDITGLLVVLAFVISLIITFGTVLYTYLSISLPKEAYNPFDALVIPNCIINRSLTGSERVSKQKNLVALTNLILTMSDQHLVTGTAMLITSYAIALGAGKLEEEKSVYSLRVATSLATLAAIAHISTLFVLRFRFEKRTADVDVRLVILLVMIVLTSGARLRSSSTSYEEDQECIAKSRVKMGLLEPSDKNANTRVAATIMEMAGLWLFLYSSLKAYLQLGTSDEDTQEQGPAASSNGTSHNRAKTTWSQRLTAIISPFTTIQGGALRSLVRWCFLRRKLEESELQKIQTTHDKRLGKTLCSRLLFTVMTLCSSSLVEMLWLLLFFIYGLVELFWIYWSRLNHDVRKIILEPSFGQLMPILVLSGSLLGVLTTWIEIFPPRQPNRSSPKLSERFRRWIKSIPSKKFEKNHTDTQTFIVNKTDWLEIKKHQLLSEGKNRQLAWVVLIISLTAMTAVVLARIAGNTYPDALTVGKKGFIWNCIFIADVGLYFTLHILASVILGIRDATVTLR